MKTELEQRFRRNLVRVRNLVKSYEIASGAGKGRRDTHKADILRSATVFLHASLEDFLRGLEGWKLPARDGDALNHVPLAGTSGRAEKFHLGALVSHRDKSVEALIKESVREHLDRKSYNDAEAVVAAITRIGFDASPFQSLLPQLDELIARRHNIVHRADRDDTRGPGHHGTKSIGKTAVRNWADVVENVVEQVLQQL